MVPQRVQRATVRDPIMRGLRDAETRAAKVIADNVTSRLSSYFVSGGG